MPVTAVIGQQWGDEGKGKVVDLKSKTFEIAARATGGRNAGHTVNTGEKVYKLHLIPSGVFHPNKIGILGNGMVIELETLYKEIKFLKEIDNGSKIYVSGKAHVTMPWHKYSDSHGAGEKKIGTTKSGIGPTYQSKANRTEAIRIYDLKTKERFERKVKKVFGLKKGEFERIGFEKTYRDILDDLEYARKAIEPLVIDSTTYLLRELYNGTNILAEGAQGALLDYDHGTYPFVTSSNPTIGGICTGLGIPANSIENVIGIVKAYTTRVGFGPFPTELTNESNLNKEISLKSKLELTTEEEELIKNGTANDELMGKYLVVKGKEFGTTTGRVRRCGWLDLGLVKYTLAINGVNEIALTKLDVLDGLPKLKIGTNY
ncbi:MAG: adenylosuccinate synthetase, partial [archaeon]